MPSDFFNIKRETLRKFLPDHKTIKQFERLFDLVSGFGDESIQFITSATTITATSAFCSGSGYIVSTPAGPSDGQPLKIFNTDTTGFITISQVESVDFKLYAGETLDMIYTGTEWQV